MKAIDYTSLGRRLDIATHVIHAGNAVVLSKQWSGSEELQEGSWGALPYLPVLGVRGLFESVATRRSVVGLCLG